tara:strand:- start:262 stop:504 length:243 start_codon:yes stop_codon:yes gene_type:complete
MENRMLTEKISPTGYTVTLYDWDIRHDDYLAGTIKRDTTDEDSDRFYWRFYPIGDLSPICAGDLRKLSEFIQTLNKDIKN